MAKKSLKKQEQNMKQLQTTQTSRYKITITITNPNTKSFTTDRITENKTMKV